MAAIWRFATTNCLLPLERNIVINASHPAVSQIQVVEMYDFMYDPRMFQVGAHDK
ncbi:hypothetical protein [Pseudomonas putida]|jgi:hypothetical protein|uniref:hypothetical protein n=1 Tax=Pseudomonas putida TaxID=303 RepID=UPI0015E19FD1|nr:hypothetical protein [Pseudomonas putida]